MRRRAIWSAVGVAALLAAATITPARSEQGQQAAKDPSWSQFLPPGEGRDLVLDSCATCHDLKMVVEARKSRSEWSKNVDDMIQRGSPVFPEEIAPMKAYLAKNFGADVPKLVSVNAAGRDELTKLPGVTPEAAGRLVEARGKNGRFKTSEEVREALGMNAADFEKVCYLLSLK